MVATWPWLRNNVRHRLKGGLFGALLGQIMNGLGPIRIRLVSATRHGKRDFWNSSALGRSLVTWRTDHRIDIDIAFDNRRGLGLVYNEAFARAGPHDAVLFLHDDVWLDDPRWIEKVLVGLKRFDVMGVAGNRRRLPEQSTWHMRNVQGGMCFDFPHLSGSVAHGEGPKGEVSHFGPTPMECELVDGVFLAVRKDVCEKSGVAFDTRFDFHFYDMDFCRTARSHGLKLGTWPIAITHQSTGNFQSDSWNDGLQRYRAKWKR